MLIALDFDGVLCDLKGIIRPHYFGTCKPKRDAVDAVKWLVKNKHEVWVLTARPKKEWSWIENWLLMWGFPKLLITDIKTNATIYLDDRAVRFTNWQDFCKLIG